MGSFKLNKFKVELAQRMFKDLLTKVVQRLFDHVIKKLPTKCHRTSFMEVFWYIKIISSFPSLLSSSFKIFLYSFPYSYQNSLT